MFSTSEWLTVATIGFGFISTVFTVGWWLKGEFAGVKLFVGDQIKDVEKRLAEKLEYHERHDDIRFANLINELWDIRVHNAAHEGLLPKPAPRKKADS